MNIIQFLNDNINGELLIKIILVIVILILFLSLTYKDAKKVQSVDPAIIYWFQVYYSSTSMYAIWMYRIAHVFFLIKLRVIACILSNISKIITGVEIHPGAVIGKRFVIDHGYGIVIGETAIIGDDCLMFQGVTLGGTCTTTSHNIKRHPTLGNNVMVGAGAKVLGDIIISDNVKIGANSVVLKSVLKDNTAVGVPAHK